MNHVPATLGLSAPGVTDVLEAASLVPSLHNSQPWRSRVLPHQIELHADLDRSLPATDPEQRELRLSCGAALLILRLALGLVPASHRSQLLHAAESERGWLYALA